MSLLARLILGVVGLTALATLLASSLLQSSLGASYAQIERDAAQREMQRLVSALEIEARSLGQLLLGWAHWSEMYAYVASRDSVFRRDNLNPAVLVPSDLAWVLVIAPGGQIVDAVVAPSSGPAPDLASLQKPGNALMQVLGSPMAADAQACGIAVLAGVDYLACRMPIRDSAVMQPPRGIIVLARRFDEKLIRRVQAESLLAFSVAPSPAAQQPDEVSGAPIVSTVFGRASTLIRTRPDMLELRQTVSDLNGHTFAALTMQLPREISALGRSSLHRAQIQLLAVALLAGALLVFAIDRALVYRLRRLTRELDRIRTGKDWSLRVADSHHDEIGRLVVHTNALLAVIGEQVRDLELRATTDALTGLANRRAFDERLALALRRQQRGGSGVGLVMLDLDNFKSFNDRYGHAAGDQALAKVGAVLRSAAARATDLCARLGGEEFAILLENADPAVVMNVAKHVRFTVESLGIAHKSAPHGTLTVSVGVAQHQFGEDAETFYMRADAALYRAKEGGRNRIELAREGLPVVIEASDHTSRL